MVETGVKRTIVSTEAEWHLRKAEECEEIAQKHGEPGGNAERRQFYLDRMASHRDKAEKLLLDFQRRAERLRSMLHSAWARSVNPQDAGFDKTVL